MEYPDENDDDLGYSVQVGERLRSIRKQKRLSLHDVEAQSNQEFKASVLGAYERGERALSLPRLDRLSQFYRVPVDQLLPRRADDPGSAERALVELVGELGLGQAVLARNEREHPPLRAGDSERRQGAVEHHSPEPRHVMDEISKPEIPIGLISH